MCLNRKFPKLREDGSFSIEAIYRIDSSQTFSSSELAQWLEEWIGRNNPWEREWSSGKTETLDFFKDFRRPPRLLERSQDKVVIRFEGQPGFKWWKDWFVLKFCKQLIDEFPGIIDLERCENSDEKENTA